MKVFLLLLISLTMLFAASASNSFFPVEHAVLHYRLIGFTVPAHHKVTHYRLEIFEPYNTDSDQGASRKLITKETHSNRIIATVPEFGHNYSWKITYLKKNRVLATTPEYHFSVAANPFSDTNTTRLRIIDSATWYYDLCMFFDNTRSLYNISGEALWYLPVIPGITDSSCGRIRDLKMTKDGTITFMTEKNVHEIDYNGNVLWSGPNDELLSRDTTEQYHHEITKLSNGHYMVIGNKLINEQHVQPAEGKQLPDPSHEHTDETYTPCGTVVEYNSQQQIVWTWNSCDYLHAGDPQTHFNAFYFDEDKNVFYTSYRNISLVVKAAYPSGEVLARYGAAVNGTPWGNGMFYSQHNCSINSNGDLCLFNNNFNMLSTDPKYNDNRVSSVIVFHEPATKTDSLKKLWEFSCDIDTFAPAITSGGGSMYELDSGDYLVCMGLSNRDFIVSNDKKILWNVLTETYSCEWKPLAGYRVCPVRKKDLRKLLFR